VIGLSFPGVPGFPHFGHNADSAWCITHGMADDQDVYVVDLRRVGEAVEYRHERGWRTASVRRVDIPVAGEQARTVGLIDTHLGPVAADHLDGNPWPGVVLRWTATVDVDTTFDALLPMARATSVDDLDRAFEPWVLPVNNVLMADTGGAIAYRMRGRLADRRRSNGWVAVEGADPATAWIGVVDDA